MDAAEGIHEGNERFMNALREADIATMPSLYTRDATILPPDGAAVTGAAEIAEFWQAFCELGITEVRPVTREVIPIGAYALEVGESTVYGQDGALVDRGKTMVLWKQDEDGVWKIHRDTWNSSIPPWARATTRWPTWTG